MTTRSGGAAGRPFGRPAVTCLLALVLLLGVATVLLHPSSSSAQAEEESQAVGTTESPAASPEPSEPAASEPPADPAPPPAPTVEEESPPEPAPSPPEWDRSASYDVPGSAARPQGSAPAEGDGSAPAPAPQPEPTQPDAATGAYNQSRVLQAILQVQVGCRTHCRGTGLGQSGSQGSNTTQNATAVAPDGSSGGAAAVNDSSTLQFMWQMQLGCVAFCWDTTMSQSGSQDSQTTQTATAAGDMGALALNLAETIQYIWQFQEGCTVECYGVSESQSLSQSQGTTQAATATGPDYTGWRPDASGAVPAWLTAFAQNIGATLQLIYQYQEATCLEHCDAETLLQEAVQQADTNQSAAAGDVPEPVTEPPVGTPPPPGEQPAASGSEPVVASAAQAPAGRDGRGRHSASGRSRWSRSATRAERGPSSLAGLLALAGATGTAAAPGAEADSGTAAASEPAAADPRRSKRSSSSAQGSPSADTAESVPAAVSLDTSTASSSTDGSEFPWLTAGLLLLAAFAATMGLRTRPGFGT